MRQWKIALHEAASARLNGDFADADDLGLAEAGVCAGEKVGHRSGGAVPLRAA
jgi:hypothetical protein